MPIAGADDDGGAAQHMYLGVGHSAPLSAIAFGLRALENVFFANIRNELSIRRSFAVWSRVQIAAQTPTATPSQSNVVLQNESITIMSYCHLGRGRRPWYVVLRRRIHWIPPTAIPVV